MNKALLQCGGDQLLSEPVLQDAFTWAHCHQCKSNTQATCKNQFFVDLMFHSLFFSVYTAQFFSLSSFCVRPEKAIDASVTEKQRYAGGGQDCMNCAWLLNFQVLLLFGLGLLVPSPAGCKAWCLCPWCSACLGLLSLVDRACEEESSGNEMS